MFSLSLPGHIIHIQGNDSHNLLFVYCVLVCDEVVHFKALWMLLNWISFFKIYRQFDSFCFLKDADTPLCFTNNMINVICFESSKCAVMCLD